jgi:hypothetical protein
MTACIASNAVTANRSGASSIPGTCANYRRTHARKPTQPRRRPDPRSGVRKEQAVAQIGETRS